MTIIDIFPPMHDIGVSYSCPNTLWEKDQEAYENKETMMNSNSPAPVYPQRLAVIDTRGGISQDLVSDTTGTQSYVCISGIGRIPEGNQSVLYVYLGFSHFVLTWISQNIKSSK